MPPMLPRDPAALEKVHSAERNAAWVRVAVVALNVGVFALLLDPAGTVRWLGWSLAVIASTYAAYVALAAPYRRYPLLLASYFTTATDAALIALWIVATGGPASPFYLLWFVSLVAVAYRFGPRVTMSAAAVYAACDLAIFLGLAGGPQGLGVVSAAAVVLRPGYLFLVAGIAALMSRDTYTQTRARVEMRTLQGLGPRVHAGQGPDAELRAVMEAGLALVGADRGAVYLQDEAGALRCAYAVGLSPAYLEERSRRFRELPGYQALQRGEALRVADAQADRRLQPLADLVRSEGFRSYATFPLRVGQRPPFGLLSLYRDRVLPFADHEMALGATLAEHAAIALENARLLRELRASEEQHRALASQLSEAQRLARLGSYEWDLTAGTLVPSEELCRMHGWAPGRERTEEDYLQAVVPKDRPLVAEALRRQRAGVAGNEVEYRVCIPGGAVRHLRGQGHVVRDAEGQPLRVLGTVLDVTEERRREGDRMADMERRKELERLRELDRMRNQFVNTAAHELNTPLTPVKVQLHLLRKALGPEPTAEQRRSLTMLDRNVDRLARLVRDILEAARLQAGRLPLKRAPVELSRSVVEAVESFEDPAHAAGVVLDVRMEPGLLVDADDKRIMQVLFNLLSNALKFTPPGGRVTVEATRRQGQAEVRVCDTGEGLRPEDIAKLFHPFTQVHDPADAAKGGTGLGLYIARGIVEAHGGRIWAESEGPGKGAMFAFTLPLHADARPSMSGGAAVAGAAPAHPSTPESGAQAA